MFLKKHTLETRQKMSKSMTGIKRSAQGSINIGNAKRGLKLSEEHKKKISEGGKGRIVSDDTRKRMSEGRKKIMTPEFRHKLGEALKGKNTWMTGRVVSVETRKKIADSQRGEKSHKWKGGTTVVSGIIRGSFEYKLWRTAVFERDGYACIWGGKEHGNKLNADHIKPFASYPELRFAIDNGRTLCEACHRTTDTWGGRKYD